MPRAQSEEFGNLDPALQQRIRRTLKISGAWFGLVVLGAIVFTASRPYLDKKRIEREKQPGYIKPYRLKEYPGYSLKDYPKVGQ